VLPLDEILVKHSYPTVFGFICTIIYFFQLHLTKILRYWYIKCLLGREDHYSLANYTVDPSLIRIKLKLLIYKQEKLKGNKTEIQMYQGTISLQDTTQQ